ncbi:hypothetical protein PENTCL1PPCAC_3796, partial [Pristionchus entomophagus]
PPFLEDPPTVAVESIIDSEPPSSGVTEFWSGSRFCCWFPIDADEEETSRGWIGESKRPPASGLDLASDAD